MATAPALQPPRNMLARPSPGSKPVSGLTPGDGSSATGWRWRARSSSRCCRLWRCFPSSGRPSRSGGRGWHRTYAPPSAQHLLGADKPGRDILSRLMVGAQISLDVGVGTQIIVAVGRHRGRSARRFLPRLARPHHLHPDQRLLRDPGSPGRADPGAPPRSRALDKIIIAIAATRWMDMARLVRGQILSLREREFVEAARAAGAKSQQDPLRHILPERARANHRPGHLWHPTGDPVRGLPQLSRTGRSAAHPLLGLDGGRRLPCAIVSHPISCLRRRSRFR